MRSRKGPRWVEADDEEMDERDGLNLVEVAGGGG